MTSYIDPDEEICICCGFIKYDMGISDPIPEPVNGKRGRGRPKGHIRHGETRLD